MARPSAWVEIISWTLMGKELVDRKELIDRGAGPGEGIKTEAEPVNAPGQCELHLEVGPSGCFCQSPRRAPPGRKRGFLTGSLHNLFQKCLCLFPCDGTAGKCRKKTRLRQALRPLPGLIDLPFLVPNSPIDFGSDSPDQIGLGGLADHAWNRDFQSVALVLGDLHAQHLGGNQFSVEKLHDPPKF